MFLLAFATQYLSDLNSDFWFKESKQATTMGFPTANIISKYCTLALFLMLARLPVAALAGSV
jgi:hypothetical protein